MTFKLEFVDIGYGQKWPIDVLLTGLFTDKEMGEAEWWRRMAILQNAAGQASDTCLLDELDRAKKKRYGCGFPRQEVTTMQNIPASDSYEERFHYIHVEIEDEEAWHIHHAIKRLVANYSIPEICKYLKEQKQKGKLMLPSNPSNMYNELVRLGMPEGKGFSEKNFSNSYTK